ncbi:MAG: ASPIC/UnbV domain-containing protein, partial [Pedosphaera parvula]|nr:ASPIC/UnbV domain-containing protein [Pedosphaera parvula]
TFYHGLRVTELCRLKRQDVDLTHGRIWIQRLKGSLSTEQPLHADELRTLKRSLTQRGNAQLPWLFLNERGKAFLEAGYPMSVSLEDDCRTVVCDDLDGDGKLELLVTSLKVRPKMSQALHLFPNFTADAGNWIGVRLRASRPGFSPVGAKVILTTSAGQQIRFLVTGDSYRSQHAPTAHFGLGSETRVQSLEVIWPNGQRKKFVDPAVNRYHLVLPGDG